MKNTVLIAMREFKERIGTRSFILFSVLGPLLVLGLVYALFALGGQSKQHWNVLIADHGGLFENKIMSSEDNAVTYFFANGESNWMSSKTLRNIRSSMQCSKSTKRY